MTRRRLLDQVNITDNMKLRMLAPVDGNVAQRSFVQIDVITKVEYWKKPGSCPGSKFRTDPVIKKNVFGHVGFEW